MGSEYLTLKLSVYFINLWISPHICEYSGHTYKTDFNCSVCDCLFPRKHRIRGSVRQSSGSVVQWLSTCFGCKKSQIQSLASPSRVWEDSGLNPGKLPPINLDYVRLDWGSKCGALQILLDYNSHHP